MLNACLGNPETDIAAVMDTLLPDDDIITACGHLITSLDNAASNGKTKQVMLLEVKENFFSLPVSINLCIGEDSYVQ